MSSRRPDTVPAVQIRHVLLLAYVVLALGSLTGVLFRGVMTADGLYLGLPAGLAWVTGWALVTFVVVAVYHLTRPAEGEGDA